MQACECSDELESPDNSFDNNQKGYDEETDEQNSESTKDESNMLSKNDITEASRFDSVNAYSAIDLSSTMEINHLEDDLIYPGARITNAISMLLIMTFATTYNLSGTALKDLLSLISIHCLVPHKLLQSLYKFKQYFSCLKTPIKNHYYCPRCSISINHDCNSCPNTSCQFEFNEQNKCFFIQLSIADQLKAFFNRKGFFNDLMYRFNRKKFNLENIEDIYDGLNYQKYFTDGGFLAKKQNISFIWNTDGIPVFKSSKFSIWPLYLAINELPPQKRWCSNNLILAGLWFGNQKPNMLVFLKSFADNIANLHLEGIEVSSPDVSTNFICRAMLLCGTCDLPAKAMVYNMIQFNGKYGCTYCKQSGEHLWTSTTGGVHVYPYISTNPTGPPRTNIETEKHSHEAILVHKPVVGVKGPSWLSTIPNYDLLRSNVIDYMHCVLLGVTKMLLKLWFDSEYSKELWYCGGHIQEVDTKFLQIKPPSVITRVPRSIQHHRHYWKASEYCTWLLFYSIPVMLNILLNQYLAHHMLLVESLFILLQHSISPAMIEKAQNMLQHYCFKMEVYYSKRCMTANLHHLLHLPQSVYNNGPLFMYSCFPFEGKNGQLLRLIKGTQHIDQQIIEAIGIMQKLPYVVQNKLPSGSEAADLYYQMTSVLYTAKNSVVLGNDCSGLGPVVSCGSSLSDSRHQVVLSTVTTSKNLGEFY